MKKNLVKFLMLYSFLPCVMAFAEDPEKKSAGIREPGSMSLIFSTIGVTIAVVLSIVAIARFIKYINSVRPGIPAGESETYDNLGLEKEVAKELGDSPQAKTQSALTAQAIKKVFDRELAKKAQDTRREMNNKFHAILKEKDLEYSAVDRKYKEVLGDKKQTESVLRSIAEGLVVLNDKGEIMMLNPAAEQILGVTAREKGKKPIDGYVGNEGLMSLVKKKDASGKEVELTGADEDIKKTIKSSSAVIEDDKGQTIGMVSVLTDVTKQKELDALKSKFFSSVSHELRVPLVAIRNSIALMMDKHVGKLNEEQEKITKIADRNLKRLRLLVDDILDFSKLEAKKISLNPVPSSIEKVLIETCDTFTNWANSRMVKIVKKIEKNIPDVKFDPDRITQVVSNILSNSIKFTPKNGTITIGAALASGGDNKELVVTIKDTGPGIAKEDISKLFNQYQQLGDRPSKMDVKGTGLGLFISKELIELHKGRIWAESELGKGTKFIFTIPVGRS